MGIFGVVIKGSYIFVSWRTAPPCFDWEAQMLNQKNREAGLRLSCFLNYLLTNLIQLLLVIQLSLICPNHVVLQLQSSSELLQSAGFTCVTPWVWNSKCWNLKKTKHFSPNLQFVAKTAVEESGSCTFVGKYYDSSCLKLWHQKNCKQKDVPFLLENIRSCTLVSFFE